MAKIREKTGIPASPAKPYEKDEGALIHMLHASELEEDTHWFQLLPAAFFTAFVILITRMHVYTRDMSQFYWSGQGAEAQLTDFFSYFKMAAIVTCAALAIAFLLYRVFTQSLYIQKSLYYYPMIVYSLLVLLSYAFSSYREFALWGYNDRFEGTIVLLGYMAMLFYLMNTIKTENNVKWIIYPLAGSSFLLGLLGISQAFGFDFFRTAFGKKMITPGWFWDSVDSLNFTFQNNEIYQTVYNINYVSFYLTLLIPLFGLLFIHSMNKGEEEPLYKKIVWGVLFALAIFNLIGSSSSGGLMGVAAVVISACIILNRKIILWWKPVGILIVITILIGGITFQRWVPEFSGALSGVLGISNPAAPETTSPEAIATEKEIPKLDYLDTVGNDIHFSVGGNEAVISTFPSDPTSVKIVDSDGKKISLVPTKVTPIYQMDDKRFSSCLIQPAQDEEGNNYFVFTADMQKQQWPFRITDDGVKYFNGFKALVDLDKIPSVGWESNPGFGSGRGYIFSRSIPMMKETLFLGHGADTYCLYFPHNDYVGKYYSETFTPNIDIIVDKPHNMYIGMTVGTGGISLLAFLALMGLYIGQSVKLYFRSKFETFTEYAGAAILFGVCGFLTAALVNDSTVSTMPMFYGLLGTGIAINMMLKRQINKES